MHIIYGRRWNEVQQIRRRCYDVENVFKGFEGYIAGGPGAAGPRYEGLFTWGGCRVRSPHIFSLTSLWQRRLICWTWFQRERYFKPTHYLHQKNQIVYLENS